MTAILGISALYHDSAAALVVDGEIIAAAQEERFSRIKHDARIPVQAIQYCMEEAKLAPEDIDYVGFYEKPFLRFERLLESFLAYAPRGFRLFSKAMPVWLNEKLHVPRLLRKAIGNSFDKRIVFAEHHESHAASAFFPSPFQHAAILTLDGVGEWATATIGLGDDNHISVTHEMRFPHSLGLLYSAFTYYCGFRVNDGEYKLMGLAPFGVPRYVDTLLQHVINLKDDGSFRLDMSFFRYCHGLTMTSQRLHTLLGGQPRTQSAPITQRHKDIAASLQAVTEEIMVRCATHLHKLTRVDSLCMAGGVALNCVANSRLLRDSPFTKIWVQPAAGDAGGALGVALLIWHQLLGNPRTAMQHDVQHGSLLGPQYETASIRDLLTEVGAVYKHYANPDALCNDIASSLKAQLVVAWMHGRMEFGPRALGARSILGDARSDQMQRVMNEKVKRRETFRPFAPSVLQERAHECFAIEPNASSPYMLFVFDVLASNHPPSTTPQEHHSQVAHTAHSPYYLPAVTHIDNTSRIQTVDATRDDRFYSLLQHFDAQTGCPAIINTSFNVRDEPIVCTPQDALRCFLDTNIDVLVIEDFVLHKTQQPSNLFKRYKVATA